MEWIICTTRKGKVKECPNPASQYRRIQWTAPPDQEGIGRLVSKCSWNTYTLSRNMNQHVVEKLELAANKDQRGFEENLYKYHSRYKQAV
jgi:hypothetical protein